MKRVKLIEVVIPPKPVSLRQKFEAWVASWFPGFKTRITAALGAVGSAASLLQNYIPGIPPNKYVSTEALATFSFAMFTLSYWFKSLGDRYSVQPEVAG